MKLLIASATSFEVYDFKKYYDDNIIQFHDNNIELDFLVTGVGTVATVFNLMRHHYESGSFYDGLLQAGIAGSFRSNIKVGDMVQVESEAFGDVGAESADGEILDLFDLNLRSTHESPFDNKLIFESESFPIQFKNLKNVHGLTVNLGSGQANTIAHRRKKFASDIESMEGAALFYFASFYKIPVRQLRCISNPVTPRDISQWQIKSSIDILNQYLIKTFSQLLN